jgi:hyperosmotically inducible protein
MKTKIQNMVLAVCLGIAGAGIMGCDNAYESDDRLPGERTTGEAVDDRAVTDRVEDALDNDSVKYPDIQVSTFRGVVQLSGFVDTQEQKQRAGDIAEKVAGVKEVKNEISLKDERNP